LEYGPQISSINSEFEELFLAFFSLFCKYFLSIQPKIQKKDNTVQPLMVKKSKQDMVASLVVKVRTLFHFQTTQTISCYMLCTFQATLIKLI